MDTIDSLNERINLNDYLKKITHNLKELGTYNLFITGGGFKGIYGGGILAYILKLKKLKKININKIYATSSGCLLGLIYFLSVKYKYNINLIFIILYELKKNVETKNINPITDMLNMLFNLIENDFYKCCNKKFNITLFKMNYPAGRTIINDFKNNEHLKDVINASCNILFLSSNSCYFKIDNNYYLDGIYPLYKKSKNKFIYINNHNNDFNYTFQNIWKPNDNCMESLVLRGIYDCHNLFKNNISANGIWITNNPKYQINFSIKYIIVIILVLYLFSFIDLIKFIFILIICKIKFL